MTLEQYLQKAAPKVGPEGVEVFDSDITLTTNELRFQLADAFKEGYTHRTEEEQAEMAGAYLHIIQSLTIAPIKLPFWRRWFLKLPKR